MSKGKTQYIKAVRPYSGVTSQMGNTAMSTIRSILHPDNSLSETPFNIIHYFSSSGYKMQDGLMKQKVQSVSSSTVLPDLCKASEFWDGEGHKETRVWWRQAWLKSCTFVEHFMFTYVPNFGLWKGTRVSVSFHMFKS